MQKKLVQQCVEENDELRSVEVNILTEFIKDEVETSADEVHVIDDDFNDQVGIDDGDKQERMIGFR